MVVYGYDDEKRVVAGRLPAPLVAAARVDPFRLDLFDPEPIALEVANLETGVPVKLNFSALADIAFGLGESGAREGYAALYRAGQVTHFSAPMMDANDGPIPLTVADMPGEYFWEQFSRFLRRYDGDPRFFFFNLPCTAGENIGVHNGRLVAVSEGARKLEAGYLHGRTYDRVPIAMALHPAINRVFEEYSHWQPVVFGGCLRDALMGVPFTDINVMVQGNRTAWLNDMKQRDYQLWAEDISRGHFVGRSRDSLSFRIEDVTYRFMEAGGGIDEFWTNNDFSINQIVSTRPDEVVASRIAIHDIARREFRVSAQMPKNRGRRQTLDDRSRAFQHKNLVLHEDAYYDLRRVRGKETA